MTFTETKDFLVEIVGIYPNFRIMDGTVKAWADRLPDLSPEKAGELLDKWLEGDDGSYPPKLDYFIKGKKPTPTKSTFWSNQPVIFHVGTGLQRGTLLDQENREYCDPDAQGDYYLDTTGNIRNCNGELVQWMDERGYIHNSRGVFFRVPKKEKTS